METKLCKKCNQVKDVSMFYENPRTKDGYWNKCKDCFGEYNRSAKSKESKRKYRRKHRKTLRTNIYRHYCKGKPKCQRCGFSDIRALSFDHVNSDGAKERRLNRRIERLAKWIIDNNYPPSIQILCMNCQFIKRHERNEDNHTD